MKILVLEDREVRIRWLQRVLRRQHPEIEWTDQVEMFVGLVRGNPDADLILMDHDLHTDGDGRDAVRLMPRVDIPIIVWSANYWAGPEMVEMLVMRHQPVLGWYPFGVPELLPAIRHALSGGLGTLRACWNTNIA